MENEERVIFEDLDKLNNDEVIQHIRDCDKIDFHILYEECIKRYNDNLRNLWG